MNPSAPMLEEYHARRAALQAAQKSERWAFIRALLQLSREGNSGHKCAELLGVSQAHVCRVLKHFDLSKPAEEQPTNPMSVMFKLVAELKNPSGS